MTMKLWSNSSMLILLAASLALAACKKGIKPPAAGFDKNVKQAVEPGEATFDLRVQLPGDDVGRHVEGIQRVEAERYHLLNADKVVGARVVLAARAFGLEAGATDTTAMLKLRLTRFEVETADFFAGNSAKAWVEGEMVLVDANGAPIFEHPLRSWKEVDKGNETVLFAVLDEAIAGFFSSLAERLEANPKLGARLRGELGDMSLVTTIAVLPVRLDAGWPEKPPAILDEYLARMLRDASGREVLGDDELTDRLSFAQRHALLACDSDPCLADQAEPTGAGLLFLVQVVPAEGAAEEAPAWMAKARLFDVRRVRTAADAEVSVEPTGKALMAAMRALAERLAPRAVAP